MNRKEKIKNFLILLLKPLIEIIRNKRIRQNFRYYRYLKYKKIKKNTFLLESYHAVSTTGNVYAIFKQLLKDNPDGHYYWVSIEKSNNQMTKYLEFKNVEIIEYESWKYYKMLATCEYLVNDTSFMPYFVKKQDQKYINTWHGTPLKTLGKDIKNAVIHAHKNIQRNLLQTDILLMPNQFTAEKLLESHDLSGVFKGQVFVTGNARVDLNFLEPLEVKEKYQMPLDKKIILYAPTWKKTNEETTEADLIALIDEVRRIQENVSSEYQVLLKTHYFIYDYFVEMGLKDKVVPNWVDTNELLSCVDRLITDYSSIFFDYLSLKRPIYFYIPDKKKYESTRGFYLDIDQLPGGVYLNLDSMLLDLTVEVNDYQERYSEKIDFFLQSFCYMDDGQASKRSTAAILNKISLKHECIKFDSKKEVILLYSGGLYNNGITSSIINLSKEIDYEKYELVIIESTNMPDGKKENIEKLDSRARLIFLFSNTVRTFISSYNQNLYFQKGWNHRLLSKKTLIEDTQWELKRVLGNLKPSIAIDFGGYNKVFSTLIGLGEFNRKSIYLHSVMMEEYEKKIRGHFIHKKDLNVIFSIYNLFDRIVSVSESSNERNRNDLSQFILNKSKMIYINNVIDSNQIIKSIEETRHINEGKNIFSKIDNKYRLPYSESIDQFGVQTVTSIIAPAIETVNFVSVGRLSPEKNYISLLKAFSIVYQKNANIRLFMVGNGPLLSELQLEIQNLGLEDVVMLYGYLPNPAVIMNLCDCLISSSNYEGQGLVLLEAMIIGKCVIGTNVVGNKSVLKDYPQSLVENTIEGLVDGMERFLSGQIPVHQFDSNLYNLESMTDFCQMVLGECHTKYQD
ncbi:CDP-glycerol glycerophosphotransferase family protein [Enterococcus sp. LJL98]